MSWFQLAEMFPAIVNSLKELNLSSECICILLILAASLCCLGIYFPPRLLLSSHDTTAVLGNHKNNSKAKYGNITAERTGSGPGNVTAANFQTADKADLETKDIHAIDHRSNYNIDWK